MAKKKGQNNEGGCDGGGNKENGGVVVVVLKIDLHCEGCAGKVVKSVRSLDGVESVRIGDSDLNKLTVIGKLDPAKLRQKVEEKTKKKVEVISPAIKKEKDDCATAHAGSGEPKKHRKVPQQPAPDDEKTVPKKNEKKPLELPVTTAVLKVPLHCQGCIQKIHKLVSKTKGFMDMSIDKNKDLVTVKGGIDMKLLAEELRRKLKRPVEIVPAKKEGGGGDGEKKGKGGGEKKGKNDCNGGGNQKKGKGGAGAGGGGEENDGGVGGGGMVEGHRMEYNTGVPVDYPYPQYVYGSGYTANYVHAPQLFSDENPNACVVM